MRSLKPSFHQLSLSLMLSGVLLGGLLLHPWSRVNASQGEVLGIHILHPYELDAATALLKPDESAGDQWHYITIPLSLDDLQKEAEWQDFFTKAQQRRLIPIVRLVTRFENGSWQVPNRRQVTQQFEFLNRLPWPTEEKYVIVFNEPNHAPEWGGRIDPAEYARVLEFTAQWAHSENRNYKVLPAGMDLAASQGGSTAEAFWYLDQMLAAAPDVFNHIDYWNSHSYPNPGFVASPERSDKKSLKGFQHELAYLQQKTGREYQVFITETGWRQTPTTQRWLSQYYQYAMQHVWSDSRVKAVTPFVLQGAPGPFAEFSFLDQRGQQTLQYVAYQALLRQLAGG